MIKISMTIFNSLNFVYFWIKNNILNVLQYKATKEANVDDT